MRHHRSLRVRRIHGAFVVRWYGRMCHQFQTYRLCVRALAESREKTRRDAGFHEWSRQLEAAAKDKPKWTMDSFPKLGQKDDGEGVS